MFRKFIRMPIFPPTFWLNYRMLDASTIEQLTEAARKAAQNAHCPYSHFAVGAAVLTDDGKIYAGCNVENAAYAVVICAESNAVSTAIAQGATALRAVLVYTPGDQVVTPCGVCRQILNEFGADIDVFMVTGKGETLNTNLQTLLPRAFGLHNLNHLVS